MFEINRKFTLVELGREAKDVLCRENGQLAESFPTIMGTAGVGGILREPEISLNTDSAEKISCKDVNINF